MCVRARLHAYQSVSSRNATCVTLVHGGGGGGGEKSRLRGKIILNSPHLTLCGAGRRPAGLTCTHGRMHAHTHNTPGLSRKASVATWRAGVMTSIMSPDSEGEQERESQ